MAIVNSLTAEYLSEFHFTDRSIPYNRNIDPIPAEEINCVVTGTLIHLAPSALFCYLV